MKLVGWTSMVAVLIAGTAIAQGGEDQGTEKATVKVPSDMPNSHTVKEGDTLWDITQTYYGDPYRWPQVWSYNPEITNPHWIYPDATVQLRPGDGSAVDTAPRGFKRTQVQALHDARGLPGGVRLSRRECAHGRWLHHRRQRRADDDDRHRHGVRPLRRRRGAGDRPHLHGVPDDREVRA